MVTLRRLTEDFREFPATMALGTLWVVVFGLMVANQAARGGGLSAGEFILGLRNGHRFGDLTIRELYAGEVWRTITATFVHFGLLHIGMNLWALYQLGCLVESWYGAGPLVAIYVLTGGGGNLVSGAVRQVLRSNPLTPSGGGSTVIMGLVALAAVVGWRSRTRIGEHLRNQMIWVLVLTAAMGVGFSAAGMPVIDNWGHAGGALVGALIGLANRGLVRQAGRRTSWLAGGFGAAVLAASTLALVSDDRAEEVQRRATAELALRRWATDEWLLLQLQKIRETYKTATTNRTILRGHLVVAPPRRPRRTDPSPSAPTPTPPPPTAVAPATPSLLLLDPEQEFYMMQLSAALRFLNTMNGELDAGTNSADFHRARQILSQTVSEPPTLEEVREFDDKIASILARVRRDRDVSKDQAVAQAARARLD
jgi:rhomboid protease GluP